MTGRPEPPLPSQGLDGEPCHRCEVPLAADQRYCLACGARRGPGGPIDFAALLGARPAPPAPAAARPPLAGARAPVAATMLVTLLLSGIALGTLGSRDAAGGAARRIVLAFPPAPRAPAAPLPAAAPVPVVPAAPPALVQTQPPPPPAAGATDPPPAGAPPKEDDAATDDASPSAAPAPVKRVFVIMLGQASQPSAFRAGGGAPYLSGTLVPQGTLLTNLHAISHSGLATAIALLSGQAPNAQTLAGCPTYVDVAPATIGDDGQERGEGCVHSVQTATLANQLEHDGRSWRAYVEDQASGGPGVAASCRHPEPGAPDPWREPRPGDAYETARNPFVYFRAITDAKSCAAAVVDLDELDKDLELGPDDGPALSYIVPSACNDGRAASCAPPAPAGPVAADAFLARIVPRIRASKLYEDALLIVTFDRPPADEVLAPGAAAPDYALPPGAGEQGGKVGALLLSPFVRAGRTIGGRRDTYALSATVARILGLEPLAGAAGNDVRPFGAGLFAPAAREP